MKKIIAIMLAVMLVAALAAPAAVAAGTTVRVREAGDLEQLAKNCQLDSYSTNVTVVLENDIDMGGAAIRPIPIFNGTFEGGGHTISNFVINAEGSHQGLFRYVGKDGLIKNLNLQGDVMPGGSAQFVGGIAGTNFGSVKSCNFSGSVTGESNVGAIVGENYGVVSACKSEGKLTSNEFTGGIVGYNNGAVDNCLNYASINTTISESQLDKYTVDLTAFSEGLNVTEETDTVSDSGGIAGASLGEIRGCINYGTVGYQHYGYNVGGIVGRQSGYLTGCENRGRVYGRQDVGGIVGQMEPNKELISSGNLTDELNKLHDLADKALNNGNNSSDDVTDALNNIKDNTKNAIHSASNVHAEVNAYVDGTVDTINELLERIELVIDRLVPITDNISKASNKLTGALQKLDECLSTLEMNEGDLAEIDSYIDNLTAALKRMSYEMDYLAFLGVCYTELNDNFEGETRSEDMKPSLEEQQEAMDMFGYDYNITFTKADQVTEVILRVIPDLINDAAQANKAKSLIIDKLDAYYLDKEVDTDGDGIGDESRIGYATERAAEARKEFVSAADFFDDAASGISALSAELAELNDIRFSKLSSGYYKATDKLYSDLGAVTDSMGKLNNAIDSTSDTATSDLKALNDQANVVLTMISNVLVGNWQYDDVDDLSEENEQGNSNGKILSSTNYAIVEGDTNIGGIAGTMGEDKAEELIEKIADKLNISEIISSSYEARCVIRDCMNSGSITAKKDNVGGIAGNQEIGLIISCEGYGPVESTEGSYVGGIVGVSENAVRSSYAMCSIAGKSYVGGVAGLGKKITDCRTLVGISELNECTGTVAGYAEVGEDEAIKGNFYVNEELGGIDGISYSDVAQRISYEKLIADKTVPSDFSRLKLSFVADGEVIKTVDFKYGGTIDASEIPAVPEKEGFTAQWPEYDYSVLTFSDYIEAVYSPLQAAMATEETREDTAKNIVLVEGEFENYANVILNEYDGAGPDVKGEEVLEKWVMRIDGVEPGQAISYSARYLPPVTDEKTDVAIYVLKNGSWEKVSVTKNGSYLVFPCEGDTVVFSSVTDSANTTLWVVVGAAAAVIVIAVAAVSVVKKGKKKSETKAEQ